MLNGRTIYLGVLCVFFIASAVLAQSQSAIVEKIYESEGKVREHLDKTVQGIETKVDNLITTVGTLRTDVAVNKTNIENMQEDIRDLKGAVDRIWYGILGVLGTLILSIVGYFVKSWREGRGKVDNVDVVGGLTEQIARLISAQAEAQAENSAQIARLISAQAENSETRDVSGHPKVPMVDELDRLDNIRSTLHDARETV